MDFGALEVQIFVSLALVLGAAFVSLLCDFLKGNNEALRERNIELVVRQEERERFAGAAVPAQPAPAVLPRMAAPPVPPAAAQPVRPPVQTPRPSAEPQPARASTEPVIPEPGEFKIREDTDVTPPAFDLEPDSGGWATEKELDEVNAVAQRILDSARQSTDQPGAVRDDAELTAEEASAEDEIAARTPEDRESQEPLQPEAPVAGQEAESLAPSPEIPRMTLHAKVTPIDVVAAERAAASEAMKLVRDLERVAEMTDQDRIREVFETAAKEEQAIADSVVAETTEAGREVTEEQPEAAAEEKSTEPIEEQAEELPAAVETPAPALETPEEIPNAVTEQSEPEPEPQEPQAVGLEEPVREPAPAVDAGDVATAGVEEEPASPFPVEEPAEETRAEEPARLFAEESEPKTVEMPSERIAVPTGFQDYSILAEALESEALFRGTILAISVNNFADRTPLEGETLKDVTKFFESLLTPSDLGCQPGDDEFLVILPDELGAPAQRRLQYISQRLWDYQIRSVGPHTIMFSWGAAEITGETLRDAITSAKERMLQTKRNRERASSEIHHYQVRAAND